jgi:hypothetical protein
VTVSQCTETLTRKYMLLVRFTMVRIAPERWNMKPLILSQLQYNLVCQHIIYTYTLDRSDSIVRLLVCASVPSSIVTVKQSSKTGKVSLLDSNIIL